MKNFIRKILQSSYNKNISIVLLGSIIALGLPMLSTPVVSRLYSPTDFGYLGIYLSICAFIIHFTTGKYEMAIVGSQNKPEISAIMVLVMGLSILLSCIFYLLNAIFQWFEHGLLITLGLIFQSNYLVLQNFLAKDNRYKKLSYVEITKSVILVGFQLFFAFSSIEHGLIYASVLSFFVPYLILLYEFYRAFKFRVSLQLIKKVAFDHKKFPLITSFSHSLNSFINFGVLSSFEKLINISSAGHYSFMQKILSLPASMVGRSITMVFREEASKMIAEKGTCYPILKNTAFKLALMGILPFTILFFFGEFLFVFVFGKEWAIAGQYAEGLSIMFYIRFVVSPLTYVHFLTNNQVFDFLWQCTLVLVTLVLVYFCFVVNKSDMMFIQLMSWSYAALYIINLIFVVNKSRNPGISNG